MLASIMSLFTIQGYTAEGEDKSPGSMLDNKIKWSVEERVRWESRDNNYDFDSSKSAVTDDDWFLQRFRLGLTAKPAEGMTLMLQGQDSRELGSKRPNIPTVQGAEGDDEFDLRQAWMELNDPKAAPLSLKVGRMAIGFGSERLLGLPDWGNLSRSFDGFDTHASWGKHQLDAFFLSPVFVKSSQFNEDDGHDRLAGVYFSSKEWLDQMTDLYVIFRRHQNNVNNGQAQETWTPGFRFKSLPDTLGNWDYEIEQTLQFGKVTPAPLVNHSIDHYAFASHIEGGHTWKNIPWQPRVAVLYDFASGDSKPGNSTDTSFQNLLASNHRYYGQMDLFGWRNMHDLALCVSAKPSKDISAKMELHSFWLAATEDGWYRMNGSTTIRSPASNRNVDSHVGEEVDFSATWKINPFVSLSGGFSEFFSGGLVQATGTSSDAQFGYVMVTTGF